jgi:hypothetical protein
MPVDHLAPSSLVTRQFAALAGELADFKEQREEELAPSPPPGLHSETKIHEGA